MFFDSIGDVVRVVVVGTLAYAAVVAVLRVAGNRTLAKMNAFDLVVTVALGSTLATITLSADVAYLEGVVALALLIGLQVATAWVSVRRRSARRAVRSEPVLLVRDGELLDDELRRQRVTPGDVRQAVRTTGSGSVTTVAAVVLETDGTIAVVGRDSLGDGDALGDVRGWRREKPESG